VARTALVYSVPAALLALGWLQLEAPRQGGLAMLAIVLLALAPALLPRLALRLAAAGPATLVVVWLAFGRPSGAERGFFPVAWERFLDGFYDYWDTQVPFATAEQPNMHGVLLLTAFVFCLALALAVASRLPVPAVLVLLAGVGWPVTLAGTESIAFGAVLLAAALWLLAGLRAERPTFAVAAGVLLVLAGAGAATSSAVAKDAVIDWRTWEPSSRPADPVSVSYVWDANYGGIEFPKERTTVLRITGPKRSHYWRATTLDRFTADRWIEDLVVEATGPASGPLPPDPLLPPEARVEEARVTQDVQVAALRDSHLIAASTPASIDGDGLGNVAKLSSGVVRLARELTRGDRYTVDSYAPKPEPAELAQIEADYPGELWPYFQLGRTTIRPWGSGRPGETEAIFRDERQRSLWAYEGLYRQARRLAEGARTPYGAVSAIEAWLRTTGGFVYDEQPPPAAAGVPPLAHFVGVGKRGYCQQFAGAMALMLRFLGVPARVAAGFTSGTYKDGAWIVTDHNAHTWVEVWFPRHGWLTFDPTPGRGELAAPYSASSQSFNAGDAAGAFAPSVGRGPDPGSGAGQLGRLTELKERSTATRGTELARDHGRSAFWTFVALVLGVGGAIGLAKLAWRRSRYLTRDPRRLAAAARQELADFLVDQGVAVRPSATPEELQRLVREQLGIDGRRFAAAVAAARYGPPERSAAEAEDARRELRALLRLVRRGLGRPQRVRGFVALRSLRAQ
jgi:protein-glutamine gamma-glutamyltransferase